MADPTVADPIPQNPNNLIATNDFEQTLAIPPLDPIFFSTNPDLSDNFISFDADVEDFDFTFDDLFLNNSTNSTSTSSSSRSKQLHLSSDPEICEEIGDQSSSGVRVLDTTSPELCDVSGFLNFPSSNSGEFNQDCSQESGCKGSDVVPRVLNCSSPENLDVPRVLNCSSPESGTHNQEVCGPLSSQGSGNFCSGGSEGLNYPSPDSDIRDQSGESSLNSKIDQKVKVEELGKNCLMKRKKENEDVNSELRTSKYRRSNVVENGDMLNGLNSTNDEEEKRKARLMRNRESAQLSRQRKKHYVEELEDKVRAMHSTIQDLNAKISYVVAENATLRQQLSGGAVCPPQVPPPGMYPHPPMAPMGYPWMPCPPYVVKSQGSQVPLVPIPRLKPQQPPTVSTPKTKKVESKKSDGKTKKVASVSLLGLLFFILLFGGLLPMVNVNYGRIRVSFSGGSDYFENRHGRVLTVNDHVNGTNHNIGIGFSKEKFGGGKDFTDPSNCEHKGGSHPLPGSDEFVRLGNASEPLVASLYVPRNDKLVKIDGNLIIHSILASEKAMASRDEPKTKSSEATGLAVALAPVGSIPGMGRNGRQPHFYKALPSGSAGKDNLESPAADGKLQQWFREGLAGNCFSILCYHSSWLSSVV